MRRLNADPLSVKDRSALQDVLVGLTEKLPRPQVQNRLMASNDRDLALALVEMEEDAVERILEFVSGAKAIRVRDEIRLQAARHVESRYSIVALGTIVSSLESNRTVAGQRSYLRPRRPKRDQ